MKRQQTSALVVLFGVAVVSVLSGCAPTTAIGTDADTVAAVASPAAEIVLGQPLDEAPADSDLGPNQKTYNLDNGQYVVFDTTQPLPDTIKTDIAAPVITVVQAEAEGDATKVFSAARNAAANASRIAGRKVVVLVSFYGSQDGDNYGTLFSALESDGVENGLANATLSGDLSTSTAATQAWIAAQPDAASYDLITAVG